MMAGERRGGGEERAGADADIERKGEIEEEIYMAWHGGYTFLIKMPELGRFWADAASIGPESCVAAILKVLE